MALSRRSFLKWSAKLGAVTVLVGGGLLLNRTSSGVVSRGAVAAGAQVVSRG